MGTSPNCAPGERVSLELTPEQGWKILREAVFRGEAGITILPDFEQ